MGWSLATVTSTAPEDAGFLIQDSSPHVGLAASFALGTSMPEEWSVVAICADAQHLDEAENVEVAIIPSETYAAVKGQVADGEYRSLVACEGLRYR